ncbi:DNA adenine methylase, partial [Mycoplasmopsis bovis]|uniref:DNA adenine methylase n=1 Tax=Mycoplasmopsis bovis TaxID=28903 RepID=UPI003D2E9C99
MLNQIVRYFPKNIDTFYDLFAGGCDVAIIWLCVILLLDLALPLFSILLNETSMYFACTFSIRS